MNRKDHAIKICEAIEALTIVFEPLYYEDFEYLLDKYFHTSYATLHENDLFGILSLLVELKRIYCEKDKYFITNKKDMKLLQKEAEKRFGDLLEIPFKEFKNGSEILKYQKLCNHKNVKGTEKLHKFFDKLQFNEGVNVEDAKYEFFVIPQLMADIDEYAKILAKKCKPFDMNELREAYDEAVGKLPRGFLRGYSFEELNDLIKEELENATYITEPIPDHKKNTNYSYVECLALLTELEKTELYKLVDSDRVIELSINGEEVYVQILGYYGKDKAVIIYKDRKEMLYSLSLMKSDIETIPDAMYRISNLECLYEPSGFVNEEMADKLAQRNLPPLPAFVKLSYAKKQRIANAKEINLIGAVLNDLLNMMKMVDKQTISKHLGEEEYAIDDTVNQVYVYSDRVVFGEYEDDEIGIAYDKSIQNKVDNQLITKLKKCNKSKDLAIGVYIMPLENDDYPMLYMIFDVNDEKIISMEAVGPNDRKSIVNKVLKDLIKNDINPISIGFNNDITFDMFSELLLDIEKIGIDDAHVLNDIYEEMMFKNSEKSGGTKEKIH